MRLGRLRLAAAGLRRHDVPSGRHPGPGSLGHQEGAMGMRAEWAVLNS